MEKMSEGLEKDMQTEKGLNEGIDEDRKFRLVETNDKKGPNYNLKERCVGLSLDISETV